MIGLYEELLRKLEVLYGAFDTESHRFTKSSNTEIARHLGYSDAQFSRLIHQSATKGEYERAIQNITRILRIEHLEEKLKKRRGKSLTKRRQLYVSYALTLTSIILVAVIFLRGKTLEDSPPEVDVARDDMLQWSFETSFVNPYVPLEELPDDCNFPCYKYQGQWNLDKTYKVPFFQERPGFHYLATEVNMYARCLEEPSSGGSVLEGYEYQKHEIWYDLREWPVDSFIHSNNDLKEAYAQLDFSASQDFVRLADVHTFFRNEIVIDGERLSRTGKVIGRDIEFVGEDELKRTIGERSLLEEVQRSINSIARSKLEDFSRPVACLPASVPDLDFNMIAQGDKISFACQLTTAGVPMDYVKTYVLTDQYIKNSCRQVQ